MKVCDLTYMLKEAKSVTDIIKGYVDDDPPGGEVKVPVAALSAMGDVIMKLVMFINDCDVQ